MRVCSTRNRPDRNEAVIARRIQGAVRPNCRCSERRVARAEFEDKRARRSVEAEQQRGAGAVVALEKITCTTMRIECAR